MASRRNGLEIWLSWGQIRDWVETDRLWVFARRDGEPFALPKADCMAYEAERIRDRASRHVGPAGREGAA